MKHRIKERMEEIQEQLRESTATMTVALTEAMEGLKKVCQEERESVVTMVMEMEQELQLDKQDWPAGHVSELNDAELMVLCSTHVKDPQISQALRDRGYKLMFGGGKAP